MGATARRREHDRPRHDAGGVALVEQLGVGGDVAEGADRRAPADRDRVGRQAVGGELGRQLLPGDLQLAPVVVGTTDEVQLGTEQRRQREVALESCRTIPREHEVDVETQPGTGGGGHPAVVRLRRADRDERPSARGNRLGTQELQLARLVAAGTEAGEVVALHPEAGTAGQLRSAFERRRQRRQGNPRDTVQSLGEGGHRSMLARPV